jgi:hypothetical protein
MKLARSDECHETRDVLDQPSGRFPSPTGRLPLRLIVGFGFMEHGYAGWARARVFADILQTSASPHRISWPG